MNFLSKQWFDSILCNVTFAKSSVMTLWQYRNMYIYIYIYLHIAKPNTISIRKKITLTIMSQQSNIKI